MQLRISSGGGRLATGTAWNIEATHWDRVLIGEISRWSAIFFPRVPHDVGGVGWSPIIDAFWISTNPPGVLWLPMALWSRWRHVRCGCPDVCEPAQFFSYQCGGGTRFKRFLIIDWHQQFAAHATRSKQFHREVVIGVYYIITCVGQNPIVLYCTHDFHTAPCKDLPESAAGGFWCLVSLAFCEAWPSLEEWGCNGDVLMRFWGYRRMQ